MAMPTPTNVRGFLERFPDWPQDSLEQRGDIEAGSRWTIRDIGTFQILRLEIRRDFPRWLQECYEEARERVGASTEIQRALRLLRTNWRALSRAALMEASGSFGAFFSLLAEVIEQPPTPMPDRYLRRDLLPMAQNPQSSQGSSSSGHPSSPLEPPPKRMRGQRYSDTSDSYHPSNDSGDDESEQSRYDEQVKAEPVTNSCFYHFLECVTENSRRLADDGFRLEWALTQDSFHVRTPQSHFSSRNDGGLVHRANISGQWKRQSGISYCSIEVKARHDTATKPEKNQAQEASHMVGMYAQRILTLQSGNLSLWNVIPLITASQNNAFLLLGTFPHEYATYLKTGEQSDYSAFPELQEYGPFDLKDAADFEIMSEIVVALVLKIQSFGPFPHPSANTEP